MVGFFDATKKPRTLTHAPFNQTRGGEEPFLDHFFDNGRLCIRRCPAHARYATRRVPILETPRGQVRPVHP